MISPPAPAIHQFVAGFIKGDAISNLALVLQDLFLSWGYEARIFSERQGILPELRSRADDLAGYAATAGPDDIVILHLSVGSAVNEAFAALKTRKVILYHNVTPPHYFERINRRIVGQLALGLQQAAQLAHAADVNLAVSRFNARELEALGYRDVKVLPLLLDMDRLRTAPDLATLHAFDDGKVNVLFVGRGVPNKKIEDALRAFYYFQRTVEPSSRFIHVGSFAGTERYKHLLLSQARECKLKNVFFAGPVPQAQLNAFYACADLFLCMSEHEGFCIPLLESMAHAVPVLAFSAAAVPETLDGAGVLFTDKQPEAVAEMMGQVVRNRDFRTAILQAQSERLARYTRRDLESELETHLAPLLPGEPPS